MVVENAWAPSNGARIETDMAIVLENVAAGYKKPNILDVKLGARLWADDAPVAKRAKLDNVAAETTSKPLGLRIAGMRIYQGLPDDKEGGITSDGYRFHDRCYGRGFTVETISHGFEDYFLLGREVKAKSPIRKVIKRFVDDLKGLESAIENEESRMYSASLLFVYEGDQQALHDAFTAERDIIASLDRSSTSNGAHADGDNMANGNSVHGETEADDYLGSDEGEGKEIKFPAIQSLKLIDFAHAEWTPGQGSDENILHGIRNVIKILGGLAA